MELVPRDVLSLRAVLAELFRARAATAAYLVGALQLVLLSTSYTWLPTYLTRAYHYTDARAGAVSAAAILASALGPSAPPLRE